MWRNLNKVKAIMVFLNQTSKDSWLIAFRLIIMQFELYMIAEIQASWWLIENELALWEKEVFCDLPCNSNFWVASDTCNSPYLYVANVIKQVTRVTTHHIYGATHYNSITTLSQFLFNYDVTPLWL